MNQLTLCSGSYPRQINTFATPLCNIEDRVERIDKILVKDIISTQDVSEINRIYREVRKLEKLNDRISEQGNGRIILEKIISKVKEIARIGTIPREESFNMQQMHNVKNLISLYHLKSFSDKDLPIEKCFQAELRKIKNNPQILKDIANYLPIPDTLEEFDQEVAALIGDNPSDQIQKILNRKKKLIENHRHTEEMIQERKLRLAALRNNNEQVYPPYFDELLDNRYIHLFDHLIEMKKLNTLNERQLKIQQITLCEASHIILEIRDAIIRKVEKEVPNDCQNILFLLGEAGAGKSTTFCFLRGDKMERKGDSYLSKSDKEGLIGHSQTTSCTFFPVVENMDKWILVDFPGFADTHGSLISLGMEFAQKALIKKYQPRILILHSIINTGNRFDIPAQLGLRLKRLLDDKAKCTLGFTKYFEQPDFKEIEKIQDQQKEDKLKLIEKEETLKKEIKTKKERYSEYDSKDLPQTQKEQLKKQLKEKIDKKQLELEALQNRRTNDSNLPLSETIEKTDYRKKIEELENEILKQSGLSGLVDFKRFDQLDNLNDPSSYFVDFSKNEPVSINSKHSLDSDHEKLVDLFLSDLLKKMETMTEYDVSSEGIESFNQKVNESSLINTVFSLTHPEIGEFLHLPEMDPTIVKNFDKKIVKACVENYIDLVISEMDMLSIRATLNNMHKFTTSDKISTLEAKFEQLQKYVMGIFGADLTKLQNSTEIDAKWNEVHQPVKNVKADKKEEWTLPLWAKIMGGLALGIPLAIHNFMKNKDIEKTEKEIMEKILDDCCSSLDQTYKTLERLKELEKFVNLREATDKI